MANFKLSITSLDEFENAKNNLIDFVKSNCKKVKISNDILDISKTINENERALNGLIIMERYSITNLFVINDKGNISGIIHLHDILKSGLKI